jgi:hypothetical protein
MALFNILPTWVVLIGRDLIQSLGGEVPAADRLAATKPFQQAVPNAQANNPL